MPACRYSLMNWGRRRAAVFDCYECGEGADISHRKCFDGILHALKKEYVDMVVLSDLIVKEYSDISLEILREIARFLADLEEYEEVNPAIPVDRGCGRCAEEFGRRFAFALSQFKGLRTASPEKIDARRDECRRCISHYEKLLREIGEMMPSRGAESAVPFIRPRFSSSRIISTPPRGEIVKSYVVGSGYSSLRVSIYKFADKPEKLYFVEPSEYSLGKLELELLESARRELMNSPPELENPRRAVTELGRRAIIRECKRRKVVLSREQIDGLTEILTRYTAGFGIIESLLRDERIQDLFINSPAISNPLHVVVDDEECTTNVYLSEEDVESICSKLRARSGRPFSEASPTLDLSLEELNARVAVIGAPLSSGIAYAFRRHRTAPWTLPMLVQRGMFDSLCAALLSFAVDGHSTILVTGDVGSGKTSLLSSLMLEIPQNTRILTIEDTPEIPVETLQRMGWKIQRMLTKSCTSDSYEVDAQHALRAALRMGNSVIVVGEVRGEEAITLYEAMQVGAAGNCVMGTIHGASTQAVYERVVETIGVPPQCFRMTDLIIVCSRVRIGGGLGRRRKIVQVSEVMKDGDLFRDLLTFSPMNNSLELCDDLSRSQLVRTVCSKWGISTARAMEIVEMKRNVISDLVSRGMVDAESVCRSNNKLWVLMDEYRDCGEVYSRWLEWLQGS